MCQNCDLSGQPGESRRSFLGKLACTVISAGIVGATRIAAQEASPRVAKSGWARLVAPNVDWDFHGDRDIILGDFIQRKTDLKFDTRVYHVNPANLEALCVHPVILTNEMRTIRDAQAWANIREYLYRGGFVYIDDCVHVSPDLKAFTQDHLTLLTRLLPGAEVRRLSPKFPIFRSKFPVDVVHLPHDPFDPPNEDRSFYGIFDDDRMVALLCMAHLFCGWPQNPKGSEIWMEQIANIYAYATNY